MATGDGSSTKADEARARRIRMVRACQDDLDCLARQLPPGLSEAERADELARVLVLALTARLHQSGLDAEAVLSRLSGATNFIFRAVTEPAP